MRSRKDQVQAHAYVVSRLTSALVHAEPDAPESPLRRTGLGSFAGLLLGTLAVAGFLVWGLISPASKASALTTGELIMVKTTGARYVYVKGKLYPLLNWSSAMLLMAGKSAITSVAPSTLTGIPQGQPLGIVGAPDSLPASTAINTGSWLACTRDIGGRPLVSLSIGARPAVTTPPANSAVVVAVPGAQYLLWNGQRLRLDASWLLTALGLNSAPVVQASPMWLDAVPAGPDLQPLSVPDAGARGPSLDGQSTRVGQILVVRNVGTPSQFYVVLAGGVAPITATQANILLADRSTAAAYPGTTARQIPVSPSVVAHARTVGSGLADGRGAPASPPGDYAPGDGAVPCMDYAAAGSSAAHLVFAVPPAGQPPAVSDPGVTASPEGAGLISVVPDGGALVRPEAAPGVDGTSYDLVTDAGVKFPIPPAGVRALGYRPDEAAAMPAALLGLLPTGPALDLAPLGG
jgi:ESX secretion system ATPase EccB